MKEIDTVSIHKSVLGLAGVNLSEDDIIEPITSTINIIKKIDQEASNLNLDVEPSNHSKLLFDLAPDELK